MIVVAAVVVAALGNGAAVVIALVAALGSFLAVARRLSGKIATSEATSLWEESSKLRQEYKDEIRQLRGDLHDCVLRVGHLEEKNRSLSRENADLRRTIEEHEETIRTLRAEVARLTADNVEMRTQLGKELP